MLGKRLLFFAAAILILLLFAAPTFAATTLPDVVAVVNGEKITKEALIAALIDWQAPQVLDELINYRIVGQAAKKEGINITEAQVKARIEEIKKNMRPGQDFDEMLKRSGLTPGHLYSIIKAELQTEAVLRKSITVTNDDLAEYRKASHILIRIPYATGEEAEKNEKEAKDKIDKIAQEIKNGAAFDEVAKRSSEDSATKEKGGDLGWFSKNQMVPEFEKAVFEMKLDEISEPVKTVHGYHIIKLTGIGTETQGDERKELEETIIKKKIGEKIRDWRLSIRNAANIDNKLEPKKPEPKKPPTPPARPKRSTQETPPPPPEETPPPPPDTPPPAPEETPPPPPDTPPPAP